MPSQQLLDATELLAGLPMPNNPSIHDFRASYDGFGELFASEPSVSVHGDRLNDVPCARLEPDHPSEARTVLFFHGGGYVLGSLRSHQMIVSRLARDAKCRVWFPHYRLAPEHVFPAAIDDCLCAYEALLDTGVPAAEIGFAGDSAGGGLVFCTMIAARDKGLPLPACGWAICPWTDMEGHGTWRGGDPQRDALLHVEELDFFVQTYLGDKNLRHRLAAPIHADLSGIPPVLIQAGTAELLLDDAKSLARVLREAGSEVVLELEEGAAHVWHHMLPEVPEAVASMERGAAFICKHIPS